jgi:gluconolactonase
MEDLPRLLAAGLQFPEGPAFAPDGSLWCVELKGGCLVRLIDGQITRIHTGGAPNGLAVDSAGRIFFCDAGENSIRVHDLRSGVTTTLTDGIHGQPLHKPNDLAFDPQGNLIFTCPGDSRTEPSGYICCLAPDGKTSIIADRLHFPNGLAFTADGTELVLAETYRQRLWRGTWNAANRKWHGQIWATNLNGAPGPDGMAFAADGTLFVAVYGSGSILRIAADARITETIPLPGKNPTNLAFDPSGHLGLVVTEAEHGRLWSLTGHGDASPLFMPHLP